MGNNANTYNALCFACCKSLAPASGACLLFLLAGPGETQVFFSRAGGNARRKVTIRLGASTWFNEPVYLTLKAIVPLIEKMKAPSKSTKANLNVPPLQAICITDGQDNCSTPLLAKLPSLASAIAGIQNSAGQCMYLPLGSWNSKDEQLAAQASAKGQVPVFLMWVAASGKSVHLLKEASPGQIAVVDATHLDSTSDVFANTNNVKMHIKVGSKGRVCTTGDNKKGRSILVTKIYENGDADVIYLDEEGGLARMPLTSMEPFSHIASENYSNDTSGKKDPDTFETMVVSTVKGHDAVENAVTLLLGRGGGASDKKGPQPSKDPQPSALHALALVAAAVTRTTEVMRKVDPKTGVCNASYGSNFLDEHTLRDEMERTRIGVTVALIPEDPVPSGFLLQLLETIGGSIVDNENELQESDGLRRGAHTLLKLAARSMLMEHTWDKEPLAATLESASGTNISLSGHNGEWRKSLLINALAAMMSFLESSGSVEEHELKLSGSTPVELRPKWGTTGEYTRLGYQMRGAGRLKIVAVVSALKDLDAEEFVRACLQVHRKRLTHLSSSLLELNPLSNSFGSGQLGAGGNSALAVSQLESFIAPSTMVSSPRRSLSSARALDGVIQQKSSERARFLDQSQASGREEC
jgi:hypothetical protein